MPNYSPVCPDANLVVRLVTRRDDASISLWQTWRAERRSFVAPTLLRYEVTNTLHRMRLAGTADDEGVRKALRAAIALPIRLYADDDLHPLALAIAQRHRLPATYDAHYLALAERLGIDFYTGDRRLWNTVRHQLPWVRLVESASNRSVGA